MPANYPFRCTACSWTGERYRNLRRCPKCGARAERVEPAAAEAQQPAVCPTCKRPFGAGPRRICGQCKKPILHGHKWTVVDGSTIVHRCCDNPQSYGKR